MYCLILPVLGDLGPVWCPVGSFKDEWLIYGKNMEKDTKNMYKKRYKMMHVLKVWILAT